MKNFTFYAVEDSKGLVSIRHDSYSTLKALFASKADAEDCVRKAKISGLKIIPVQVISQV